MLACRDVEVFASGDCHALLRGVCDPGQAGEGQYRFLIRRRLGVSLRMLLRGDVVQVLEGGIRIKTGGVVQGGGLEKFT